MCVGQEKLGYITYSYSLLCVVIGISRWRDLSVTMHNNEFAHEIKVTNKNNNDIY